MPFEPKKITREHILKAVKEIVENNLDLTPSTQWDVIIDGIAYPPKDVLRYAHKQVNGELIWDVTGGEDTNTYLDSFGFLIRAKNERADQIRSIIQEYKNTLDLSEFSNKDEKWFFVQNYKDKVDPSSPNFPEEFGRIRFANFVYPMASAVVKDILSKEPNRYQQCIVELFQEEVDLSQRIQTFIQEIEVIYRQMYPESKKGSHHDERTIATFLTMRYPDTYTFYMETFYRKFCSLMGVKPMSSKGEKYVHYLKYIHEFTSQFVIADQELISTANQSIPSDAYPDNNHLLLAQDIVFRLLGKDSNSANVKLDPEKIGASKGVSTNPVQSTQHIDYPLNQILFGPPGTGKTYNSINLAVQIVDPEFISKIADITSSRTAITTRYRELVKEGRIVFTTFHQSMSYEDFIVGIKPITNNNIKGSIAYEVIPGIFKKLCKSATQSTAIVEHGQNQITTRSPVVEKSSKSLGFDEAYDRLCYDLKNTTDPVMRIKTPNSTEFGISLNSKNNITMHTSPEFKPSVTLTKKNLLLYATGGKVPPYDKGYFLGVLDILASKYGYGKHDDVSDEESPLKHNQEVISTKLKPYVLIIDEINRGNISQIFGELITLIEPDKRAGKPEAIEAVLPYSKDRFSVPTNLYIIGTMNTADRSVEALDTALRRRFSFREMTPEYSLLASVEKTEINLKSLLAIINQRIEGLLDKDHAIGHSYFLRVANGESTLKDVFYNEIIPLLQEYFYGNFGRIELVLGRAFVKSSPVTQSIFAKPSPDNDEFNDHIRYTLVRNEEMDEAAFQRALRVLMNEIDEA